MTMKKDDILSKLRIIIPKTDEAPNYDAIMDYTVDKVLSDISNYTNIAVDELPDSILFIAVGMSNDLIRTTGLLDQNDSTLGTLGVSSITEGDESITFRSIGDDIAKIQASTPISKDYRLQLNAYRKLRWD